MARSESEKSGNQRTADPVNDREKRRVTRPPGRVECVFRRIVEFRNKIGFESIPVEV